MRKENAAWKGLYFRAAPARDRKNRTPQRIDSVEVSAYAELLYLTEVSAHLSVSARTSTSQPKASEPPYFSEG
jgi:hypothetical protein